MGALSDLVCKSAVWLLVLVGVVIGRNRAAKNGKSPFLGAVVGAGLGIAAALVIGFILTALLA